jgi:hypothetical protein
MFPLPHVMSIFVRKCFSSFRSDIVIKLGSFLGTKHEIHVAVEGGKQGRTHDRQYIILHSFQLF